VEIRGRDRRRVDEMQEWQIETFGDFFAQVWKLLMEYEEEKVCKTFINKKTFRQDDLNIGLVGGGGGGGTL
jgi:hypothetical protein